ncbi:uncharacterized protein LOC110449873 isoform X2 [Mizuhopecten yessoensis]|uniref:Testis-expressed sequence 33 protein n=1 Tax=Mizuhopecten yessoensis TaxID=6573 RepID=A0A210QQ69_MIZYE|nr:uncharacterized protein LOC110449873 isoform X2 [Mizuhopecten yessoensis]XP_021352692.1 uncharacterized protein LOC110449873 isoform X2 [Mizuhopecten yessoensis]OWF50890.1 Testis-expressed sequence 33 protein [Mizuhopecten yessoensis]
MATALAASPIDLTELARARRTDAMPKHSLFGSSLEIHTKDEMDRIQKIDVSKNKELRRKGRFQLPEELRSQMKEYKVVQATKGEIEKQKDELLKTKRAIENMEFGALNFDTENITRVPQRAGSGRSPLSMSDNALKAAREMNYVGLNDRNSYNRDKYGHRAPMHQYSLCGDILRPGMETIRREKTEYPAYVGHSERHRKAPTETPRHTSAGPAAQPRSIVSLPPNIRHQFGSKVCDFLLSDEKKVEKTVNEEKLRKQRLLRPSKHLDIPDMDKELKPEYEMLGNAMRQNIFPGYTMNHKKSMMKLAYDDSVHLRRYPDPDQWRYQRDELSTWAEHNVLQTRMKKAWEAYFLETLAKKQQKKD